ncbi:MAG TPA: hypothetical protein VGB79_07995 [Allosphingosinicella sp.]
MRTILALPLLLVPLAAAACSVDSDGSNDQVTIEYNEQRIRDGARKTARTARDVGSAVGNVAASTGRAIGNEVGDIDVDVDVRRNRDRNGNTAGNAQ